MNHSLAEPVVWAHALCTTLMAGLVWFVQLVHYPLFARAAADHEAWPAYEREHQDRAARITAPLMLVEAATATAIAIAPPAGVNRPVALLGLALLIGVWALTFALAIPLHKRLALGFDEAAHRALLAANWPRTLLWSIRAVFALLIFRDAHAPG